MKINKMTTQPSVNTQLSSYISPTNIPIMKHCLLSFAVASSLMLVGCNDDNDPTVTYQTTVQPIATFMASQIDAELLEVETTSLGSTFTSAAKCGVTVEKVNYPTTGSKGEVTNATAALMLPSGDAAECQGNRPVLLYAHGTTTQKSYDFTQVGNTDNPAGANATLIAANFAAQGYIVVAPNYAGYDSSELDYHPYLDAEQQSSEMVTALDSARAIIKQQQRANNTNYLNVSDSGKLFIAGYSQGGHVAMATAKRLEKAGRPVTALAPSSGPYALVALSDAIFAGNVNVGATAFTPLLAIGLQKKNQNIYNRLSEVFTENYVNTKLPNELSYEDSIKTGKLPQTALFEESATETGFGFAKEGKYLIQTSFRKAYLMDAQANPDGLLVQGGNGMPADHPQNELRKTLKANDLRGYAPSMPTLICGGNQDPTVFYDLNTGSMTAIMQQINAQNPKANLNITVLDVDTTNAAKRPANTQLTMIGQASMNKWDVEAVVKSVQANFATKVNQVISNAVQQGSSPEVAFLSSYHSGLASVACNQATREFFDTNFAKS